MKNKTFVKTDKGFVTGTYNPNSYNPLDAVICFLIAIISVEAVRIVFNLALKAFSETYVYSYYFVSLLGTIIIQLVVFLVAFIFSKARRVNYLSGGGFTFRFDWVNILFACMLIVGVDLLISAVHMQFGDDLVRLLYGTSLEDYSSTLAPEPEGADLFFFYIETFILTPLLPCIFEEGLFRGVVLRGLSQFGKLFAIIVSALLFAFMHGNPMQILLQFIFGLLVGAIVMLTRNFAIGCVMHFISNFMVVRLAVLTGMSDIAREGGAYLFDAISIVIGTVFVVVSVIYFIKLFLAKYKREVLKEPEKQTYKDLLKFTYVQTDDLDENGDKVYKKVYWNEIAVGDYSLAGKIFAYNGDIYSGNKPTKKVLFTKILIIFALIVSAVLIFI